MTARPPKEEIRIGVSSCLLGHKVRYDAGHKKDALVTGLLSKFMTFVPVCPEVEVGMPVPRPAVRLVRLGGKLRLVDPRHDVDHTEAMRSWSDAKARDLAKLDLSGFILKKDSPSCGMERVKVYSEKGPGVRDGVGLFAQALLRQLPLLPVEEEGRLNDAPLRENYFRAAPVLDLGHVPNRLGSEVTDRAAVLSPPSSQPAILPRPARAAVEPLTAEEHRLHLTVSAEFLARASCCRQDVIRRCPV